MVSSDWCYDLDKSKDGCLCKSNADDVEKARGVFRLARIFGHLLAFEGVSDLPSG